MSRQQQRIFIPIIYFVVALLLTYPLIFHLSTHLPLGTEPAATVPLFNLWTLLWNADRIPALYQGYWHAPIFFPTPGTFALSEPQPLTGLLFAPLFRATGNPITAYNTVFLLHLTLNGLSGYVLTRRLNPSPSAVFPAWIMGLFAQTLPFITHEWGVLQLTALYPVLFALATLIAWGRTPTLKNGMLFALWVGAVFWSSIYYGLFLLPFVGLYLMGCFFRKQKAESRNDVQHHSISPCRSWCPWCLRALCVSLLSRGRSRFLLSAFCAFGLATLLLFPLLSGQLRYTADYRRSTDTIRNNSAEQVDYRRLGANTWGANLPWLVQEEGSGQRLYPSTGLLLLGAIGVFGGWRRGKRGWVLFALVGGGLAWFLSLGLNGQVAGLYPYEWVRDWLPGYRQLRSPFRLALFVQIFLFTLSGFGMVWLWQTINRPTNQRRLRTFLFYGGVALWLLELLVLPAKLYIVPPTTFNAPWLAWFRTQPTGAAVYLSFVEGSRASHYEATTLAMLQALVHQHPLANGYSGFFPERHDSLKSEMQSFPSFRGISMLQSMGVRYLIVESGWARMAELSEWGMLQERYHDEEVTIFEIVIGDS